MVAKVAQAAATVKVTPVGAGGSPGPWRSWMYDRCIIFDARGMPVAELAHEVDAPLIVAATEIYEALSQAAYFAPSRPYQGVALAWYRKVDAILAGISAATARTKK